MKPREDQDILSAKEQRVVWQTNGISKLKNLCDVTFIKFVMVGVAQPLAQVLLSDFAVNNQDNCSMLTGMVFFVFLNYFRQRSWA